MVRTPGRRSPGTHVFGRDSFWIVLDVLTILGAVALATVYRFHTTPIAGARGVLRGTLIHGRSLGILLILLCGYTLALVLTSRRFHLYTPMRIASILHEQRLSAQACLYSGLLLAGTLYLIHAEDISRTLVLITVGLVTVALGLRRLAYRLIIYRQFEAGVGTRNVLIIGVGRRGTGFAPSSEQHSAPRLYVQGLHRSSGIGAEYRIQLRVRSWASLTRCFKSRANCLWTKSFLPRHATARLFTTCLTRRSSMEWICGWCRACTTGMHGTARSSISASFLPFRCTAGMCRRWGCC